MPTISTFYGISISMWFKDHNPPHFHAEYGGKKASIDIKNLKFLEGELPRRATVLVLDWAEIHQEELLKNWELCQKLQAPHKIKGLE